MHELLDKAGVKHVHFEAQGTAHEFETWRKSLHGFAPSCSRSEGVRGGK
jgi:enterochelin esterase family protein